MTTHKVVVPDLTEPSSVAPVSPQAPWGGIEEVPAGPPPPPPEPLGHVATSAATLRAAAEETDELCATFDQTMELEGVPPPPPPPPAALKFFPDVPDPLRPLTPFIHEADSALQTAYASGTEGGALHEPETIKARSEAKLIAYYCICHAIWIGTSAGNRDPECVNFILHLQHISVHCRPTVEETPDGLDDEEWRDCVADLLNSMTFMCRFNAEEGVEGTVEETLDAVFDVCSIPVGPATDPSSWRRVEIYENRALSKVVPVRRPLFSDETGNLAIRVDDKQEMDPAPGYVWANDWDLDRIYTACDEDGWSYALNFSALSVHMRQNRSISVPSAWSLAKRRRWFRIMRLVDMASARMPCHPLMGLPSHVPRGDPALAHGDAADWSEMSESESGTSERHSTGASAAPAPMTGAISSPGAGGLGDGGDGSGGGGRGDSDGFTSSPASAHIAGNLGATNGQPAGEGVNLPPPKELSQAGRQVLVKHAHDMVQLVLAQEQQHRASDPHLLLRWCHTALVYLEVLRGKEELPIKLESQRRKVHHLVRTCSHMHENLILETGGASVTNKSLGSARGMDTYHVHHDQLLGKGSFGTVVRATHARTGEEFACKILNITHILPAYIDKLHSEIIVMRMMDHPNVVRLREVFYGQDRIHLVMDLCSGGELFDVLDQQPNHHCSEAFTRAAVRQMLSAIRYMHSLGIMHRDLKLENWLLTSKEDWTLQLIDFGLSKHVLPDELVRGAVGSAYYVAPEVLQGEYAHQCDLWSLGVITYMLVSGSPPFWGKDEKTIRARIIGGKYSFPRQAFKDVSTECRDFISRLLVVDPAKRANAAQALQHPWMADKFQEPVPPANDEAAQPEPSLVDDGPPTTPTDCNLVRRQCGGCAIEWDRTVLSESLREYSETNVLQKMAANIMAFHLPQQEIRGLRDLFVAIDLDSSGTISLAEFRDAVLSRGSSSETATAELERTFVAINTSHTEQISYSEFVAACMWQRIAFDEHHLNVVFHALDVDQKGYIDAKSAKAMAGLDFDAAAIDAMICEADRSGTGRVAFADFVQIWKTYAVQANYTPLLAAHGPTSPAADPPPPPSVSPDGGSRPSSVISDRTSSASSPPGDAEDERPSGASGRSSLGTQVDRYATDSPMLDSVRCDARNVSINSSDEHSLMGATALGKRRSEGSPILDWGAHKPGAKRKGYPSVDPSGGPTCIVSGTQYLQPRDETAGQTTDSEAYESGVEGFDCDVLSSSDGMDLSSKEFTMASKFDMITVSEVPEEPVVLS